MAGDKAIFVYFYQVISFILTNSATVRPGSVEAALLSYVSILFENHSNNSQNEWKCFVIGLALEKSSVTDTFPSRDDCWYLSELPTPGSLWVTLGQSGLCSLIENERSERWERDWHRLVKPRPARIKIGETGARGTGGALAQAQHGG